MGVAGFGAGSPEGFTILSSTLPAFIRAGSPATGVVSSMITDLWLPGGLLSVVVTEKTSSGVSFVNVSSGAVVSGGRPRSRAVASPSKGRE